MILLKNQILAGAVITGLLTVEILVSSCSVTHPVQSHLSSSGAISPVSDKRTFFADSLFIAAKMQMIMGNPEKAIPLFQDFLKLKPDQPDPYYELSLIYGSLGNVDGFLSNAGKAVQLDSANQWYLTTYATALAANKDYDSAARIFQKLARMEFPGTGFLYREADMLSLSENYKGALEIIHQIEKRNGESQNTLYQKQFLFQKLGESDSAGRAIRRLIETDPNDIRFQNLMTKLYLDNNKIDAGIQFYKTLLRQDPENPQAMLAIAILYKKNGDDSAYYRNVSEAFKDPGLSVDHKIAFVRPYLQYVKVDSTQKEEGLLLSGMILKDNPENAKAYKFYGDMLFNCDMPDSALVEYKRALAIDDNDYDTWDEIMQLYGDEGLNDSVLSISQIAVQRFPNQPRAWIMYGMAEFIAGQFEKSTTTLRNALQLGIDDPKLQGHIYAILGDEYNTLKDYGASDSCYLTALRLNPRDAETMNNYSYFLAMRGEHLQYALQLIREAARLKPDEETFQDTYAWVLFNLGEYKTAKVWMEKVLRHPEAMDHPGYLEHYGDILFKNHEPGEALKYWYLAKEKGGNEKWLDWKIKHKKLPSHKDILKSGRD